MNSLGNLSILIDIFKTDTFVQVVVLCMIALFIWFLIDCVGRLISVGRKFHNASDLILKVENGGTEVIKSLGDYFKQDTVALHCLKEYEESLYRRTEILDSGEVRTMQFQLSEPAASFFDVASLIENPAKINFFNHLPGIFTSFGIIGTFFGLIIGLQAFNLDTSHVESIQRGVTGLLGSVMHAFVVSATAIILALLTTFFEKFFFQRALSQLNAFLSNLDSKFVGGVSNDFMAKLLDLTEQNTTQTKQIMDGFITDLKELLTRNSEDQSKRISNAIVETFSGSLDRVSNALNDTNRILGTLDKYVSNSQQAAGEVTERVANDICSVIKVMREEMEEFKTAISDSALKLTTVTEKLENVTGDYSSAVQQVGEISKQQISDLINSMKSVVDQLSVQCSGMAEQFTKAFDNQVATSGKNLQEVTEKTQAVINNLALSINRSNEMVDKTFVTLAEQTEKHAHSMEETTKDVLEEFLRTTAKRYSEMTSQLTQSLENQVTTSGKAIQDITEKTQTVINKLTASVENMNEMFSKTCKQLADQSAKHALNMEESTKKALDGFLQTITCLNEELGKTFNSIMVCQTQIGRIVTKVTDVTATLSSSTEQSKDVATQFSAAMELQEKNLSELSAIISNFKDSLSQSDDVVLKIYDIAEKIQASNKETEIFAKDAANNLSKVFNEFQTGTQRVGIEVCAQCDNVMKTACTKLDSSINELKGTLEDFTDEIEEIHTSRKKAS